MESTLDYRTYIIAIGPSQAVIDVHVAEKGHKFALAWFLMPDEERQTTFIEIDGDEQAIISAKLTPDKKTLIVVVSFQKTPKTTLKDKLYLSLNHFLSDDLKIRVEACDNIQNRIDKVRQTKPDLTKIHFCFTETHHDLNYGS
jgi:hypothetical protein